MSIEALPLRPTTSQHYYRDCNGTYQVDRLFEWINSHPEKHKTIPTAHLLKYIIHDTWELNKTNFRVVFDNQSHKRRMMQVDLTYPIIITNFDRLVDGVHRIFKAVFEKNDTIKAVFIDPSRLNTVRAKPFPAAKPSHVRDLPIQDIHFPLPSSALSQDNDTRKNTVENYFPDHLPTATPTDDGFEVCLERASSPYGCFTFDKTLGFGLNWWGKDTRIRDICAEYKFLDDGILAIEEQWIPLSWSRLFQKMGKIPEELVLLHFDDHQDMMSPIVGKRLDGELVDYITGEHIDFMDPDSVKSAISSGAIGKGSILTPLIWLIPKIHIRHLTFRPHPNTTYSLDKVTYADNILFQSENRISLHTSDTSWESLTQRSNYVVTSDFNTWLHQIPEDIPILLHLDLDYFNNRFDGDSHWEKVSSSRSHNPRFTKQKSYLKRAFLEITKKKLKKRIIDTSIGISPGFYPGEFWGKMVEAIGEELLNLGIQQTQEKRMSLEVTRQSTAPLQVEESTKSRKRRKVDMEREIPSSVKAKIAVHDTSPPKKKRRVISTTLSNHVSEESITVTKMASKKFEGWKIKLDESSCGFVKFSPKVDKVFKNHVTIFFKIPQKQRGRHIGRIALMKALDHSVHTVFVAHLRKSNLASKKALIAAGFTEYNYPGSKQLCMVYRKSN